MESPPLIHGICDAAFTAVRAEFARGFGELAGDRERGEIGAGVAVTVAGRPVVDLWAGHADAARTRAWEDDTIVNVYSTTKGLATICGHILADRGQLDFDAPVTTYWPEFGQAGKEALPVRYLFSHQAGLPVIDTLEVLQEKTRGNLTDDETKLLDSLIHQCRMAFLDESAKKD